MDNNNQRHAPLAQTPRSNMDATASPVTRKFLPGTGFQTSPLLGLAGELRTLILENVLPLHTRIYIFACPIIPDQKAHHHARSLGHPLPSHYRYHATAPAILRVCRQLRADGLAFYYANNTFRFDNYMFGEPRAFEGFLAVRNGAQFIRRVEVSFAVRFARARKERVKRRVVVWSEVMEWVVSFVAEGKVGGGVRVSCIKARQTGKTEFVYEPLDGEEEGLCCCALEESAARVEGGDGALVKWVGEYVALAKEGGEGKTCGRCRKVRNASLPATQLGGGD